MPKISVIIPVYNVEYTLKKCLESVINQTFKDIEIICVNDATPDNSVKILEEYQKQDSRIKIVHNEKNLGLGLTRNHGMEYATGEYVHFLDSDDWLELDAYEVLVNNLDNTPDVVCFLWNNVDARNGEIRSEKFNQVYQCANFIDNPEIIKDWGVSVWHRIYRRDFLQSNEIVFNDYPCQEDVEYIYKVLCLAKCINFADKILLNYRTNNKNSLISKAYKYYNCTINSYNTIYEFSKILPDNIREMLMAKLLNSLLYRLVGSFSAGILKYGKLKQIISEIDLSVFSKPYKKYQWYIYYNEIMKYSPFILKFKFSIRLFLRNNIYRLYEILVKVRQR